ncbi:hypothetical protein D9M71_531250 [compost metagenome]
MVPQAEEPSLPLADRLFDMAQHMLNWILQPDVLGIYRMTIAEVQRFPELARMVAEYAVVDSARSFEPVFREAAGGALDDEAVTFVANQFMQTVAAEPFHRAIQGLDSPGLDDEKLGWLRRAVELFLDGFLPCTTGK